MRDAIESKPALSSALPSCGMAMRAPFDTFIRLPGERLDVISANSPESGSA
ncbi:hypothetical protein [Caulobacter sp.]|uniref:hypothetical protein n=1 Tax=Caulobacter sp. TaxID=78 RepID=UPI001B1C582F|nr:hypothetical protein [Caulobacter sp.]MBO9545798.1 hypothetical protein [Caulobacter sp.]